ncbi:MAG: glycosyltransferase [Gemmatimonadaceae bacterium]
MPNGDMPARARDWRLPVRLLDVEIGAGVDDVPVLGDFGGTRALIRRRGVPLGWVNVAHSESRVIAASEILAAVRYQLHAEVRRAAALDAMQPVAIAHREDRVPAISVIVCTRDRPVLLGRCLETLSKIAYPSYEVVVVDNASTSDDTRLVAKEWGARYVREERTGLDWARNRGTAAARHDIVAFTDDDVEVDPQWLQGIAAGFADSTVQFVTGFVMPARMDTEAELLFELAYDGMGKGTLPRRYDPARMSARELIGAHHLGIGANMAFRRSLLDALGGFDRALDVGTAAHGGGDLDIFHRALVLGAVGRYEPSALVRHHHRRDMTALQRQHYDNGRSFGVYLIGILRRGDIPRIATAWYALRIWLLWLVRRFVNRMRGRDPLPGPLIAAELRGTLHAPWAYFATKRQARDRLRAAPSSSPTPTVDSPVSGA